MLLNEQKIEKFKINFCNVMKRKFEYDTYSKIVILCIGTDKIIGDSFGPLIGYKLKYLFKDENKCEVIGDLEEKVCALNIENIMANINDRYENPFIIAVDSAVSRKEIIGEIIVSDKSLILGKALNKKEKYIGNISIKGVVAENLNSKDSNIKLLENTPLRVIIPMVDTVAYGIYDLVKNI